MRSVPIGDPTTQDRRRRRGRRRRWRGFHPDSNCSPPAPRIRAPSRRCGCAGRRIAAAPTHSGCAPATESPARQPLVRHHRPLPIPGRGGTILGDPASVAPRPEDLRRTTTAPTENSRDSCCRGRRSSDRRRSPTGRMGDSEGRRLRRICCRSGVNPRPSADTPDFRRGEACLAPRHVSPTDSGNAERYSHELCHC